MTYQNIKVKTLKKVIIDKDSSFKEELNNQNIWPKSKLFIEVLGSENNAFLQEVSKIRNIPAHDIYDNELDNKYWEKQDYLLKETYITLNTIITKYMNEEDSKKIKQYGNIFGESGRITTNNGFNILR